MLWTVPFCTSVCSFISKIHCNIMYLCSYGNANLQLQSELHMSVQWLQRNQLLQRVNYSTTCVIHYFTTLNLLMGFIAFTGCISWEKPVKSTNRAQDSKIEVLESDSGSLLQYQPRGMSIMQTRWPISTAVIRAGRLYYLIFRHRASSILGQAFRYSPENAFYIFNQHIYFIIWYLLDRASLI